MPTTTRSFSVLFVLTAAVLGFVGSAMAQQATPPWAPPAGQAAPAEAAAEPETEGGDWLMTSPMVNVGWPEIKMPKVDWTPGWAKTEPGQPGFLEGQMIKLKNAAQGAAQRTRTAWNKTVERMKIGGGGDSVPGQPGFFARMFGASPEPQGAQTVQEFLAQERPGTQRR
ncbi:MAG: hypothetical protein AAF589_02840 [Planctomycetota bacterium]